MKKIAAIDIGTNSMRLLLCEIAGNRITKKERELIVTRLGKDVSKTGIITEKALIRNIDALKYFKNKADRFGAEEVHAIATSAVRDASNGKLFAANAKIQARVDIRIISGEEEAELGLKGVMSEINDIQERVLVIDVGGGSTELVLGSKDEIDYSISIPIGCVKMTEQFFKNDSMCCEDIADMKCRLEELFREPIEFLSKKRIDKVIAIGGTATTIAAIFHGLSIYNPEIVHNTVINVNVLDNTFKMLKDMTIQERFKVKGLQKERADVIPAGIYILQHIVESLKKDSFIVSQNDSLEGIIVKYILDKSSNDK